MISSAGSDRKSSERMARQTSRVSGQTWIRASARFRSRSSRSISIRPSLASLAISQRTMAEMLQVSSESKRRSRGVRLPPSACRRTWVSRLSIPGEPRGADVALDPDLTLEAADQIRRIVAKRDQLGNRLAVLGDHDPLRIDPVEQREALLLEFGGGDGLHSHIL